MPDGATSGTETSDSSHQSGSSDGANESLRKATMLFLHRKFNCARRDRELPKRDSRIKELR